LESRRGARLIGAFALCVYLVTAGGSLTSVDAVMMFHVTKSLVTRGTTAFDVPGINNHPGVDGRFYSPFGIGQSLYNVPFYVAAHTAARVTGLQLGRDDTIEKAGVALGSTVTMALTVWLVYLFAFRLTADLESARLTALACGFATLLWPYSKFGFNQALSGACLTAGVYAAWVGARTSRATALAWSGVWLAAAFLTRHELIVPAALVVVWVIVDGQGDGRQRGSRALAIGLPLAVAFACWLAYNDARFGSALETGNLGTDPQDDQTLHLGMATLTGVAGLLFSPGRSLFLYVPLALASLPAMLGLWRRDRALAGLLSAIVASCLVLYGSLHFWEGLRGYGPRYLVPLLPILIVPLAGWMRRNGGVRREAVILMVASAVIQLPGVLVDYSKVSVDHARETGYFSRDAKVYSLTESAIVLDTLAAARAVPANTRNLVTATRPQAVVEGGAEPDAGFAQRYSFSLDFWWLYLYYFGVLPAFVTVMIPTGLLGLASALWRRVPRGGVDGVGRRPSIIVTS
jgi:hypothetical protein